MKQNDTNNSDKTKKVISDFIHPVNFLMAECSEQYPEPILLLGTLKNDHPIVFFQLDNRIYAIDVTPDDYYRIEIFNSDFTAYKCSSAVMRDELNTEIFLLLHSTLEDEDRSEMKKMFTSPLVSIPMSTPWAYTFLQEKQISLTIEPSPDIIGFEVRDLVTEIYRSESLAEKFEEKLKKADKYNKPIMSFFRYLTNRMFHL